MTKARIRQIEAALDHVNVILSNQRRPADVLVPGWSSDRGGALDLTVISPHYIGDIVRPAEVTAGSAAEAAAQEKHTKQDEAYQAGRRLREPRLGVHTFRPMFKLAGAVAARTNVPKLVAFGRLSIALQRANVRATQRRYDFTRPRPHWVWGWRPGSAGVPTAAALAAEPQCHHSRLADPRQPPVRRSVTWQYGQRTRFRPLDGEALR